MNKKQEDYLLYRLAQALSLYDSHKFDNIYHIITSEYEKLGDLE